MATDAKSSASGREGGGRTASLRKEGESPLIPLSVIDAPTQRVYAASAFVAVQTYKAYSFLASLWVTENGASLGTFLLLDFVFVIAVSRLRIPRLEYNGARWAIVFLLLGLLDWLVTGGWRTFLSLVGSLPVLGWIADGLINSWTDTFNRQLSISEHRVRLRDLVQPSHHILGQHTIHILPYSTAAFAPSKSTSSLSSCFCLDPDDSRAELSIPIIFNNTEPQFLSYSISPFESVEDEDRQTYNITISKSALVRLDGGEAVHGRGKEDQIDLELEDAYDEDEGGSESLAVVRRGEARSLQHSSPRTAQGRDRGSGKEVMYNLLVKKPGRVRLERVLDRNRFDARLSRSEILIVDCPKMGFARKSAVKDFCPNDDAFVDVWVKGLAPLQLNYARYRHESTGKGGPEKEEVFKISHIASASLVSPLASDDERAEQLTLALRGSQKQQTQALEWAAARNVSLPITLDTLRPGRQTYHLDSVRDACGNTFEAGERATRFFQEVEVHQRPNIAFESCSPERPIDLLQGGPSRQIGIRVGDHTSEDGPFSVQLHYEGEKEPWSRNITLDKRTTIEIDRPGSYSLDNVQGRYCKGEVGSAWLCIAREVPPPTASIEFAPIQDPCAGSVGVKALAVLSGRPPFRVKYQVVRQGRAPQEYEQVIQRTREEIEFRPSTEGEVTYTFTGLSDANYANLELDGPSFTQVLHPVAKASFHGVGGRKSGEADVILHSCQGNLAKARVNFEGVGPFEVTYALRSSEGALFATRTLRDVQSFDAPLDVEVPEEVAAKGGLVTVTLTSVKDAKGCDRPLTVPDLTIDVRRTKPNVAFIEPRDTAMLEGKEVALPIRLAGEGPWTVRYRHLADGKIMEAKLDRIESALTVKKPGTYEIIDVRDRHCPGEVQQARQVHTVNVRPRPRAHFDVDVTASTTETGKGSVLARPPVCLNEADSVSLQVYGHYPVSVAYRHHPPGDRSANVHSFNAAQNRTTIQLSTNVDGKHVYELLEVGDAVYPALSLGEGPLPTHLEQVVFPLPSADFVYQAAEQRQISLCLGEGLHGHDKEKSTPTVSLSGTPPFTLEYAIKDGLGAVRKTITKRDISTKTYALTIEKADFPFDGVGKWSVDLVRVTDGNGCESALNGATTQGQRSAKGSTMEIEVVESANISPVGTRADYCVGETIDFVLQGSPPWMVEYDFEGRISRANVKTTTFSRIAEQPGVLRVQAIAHQHNRCQTSVTAKAGMTKTIHALPTVHIRGGNHFVEDLREGNQAEISFTLQGEPPFSFTYQRTQAVDRYSRPQVLETHTITGIEKKTFTITTAEEGTWSVIWLQDKWCAVSLDMAAGKATPQGEARKLITAQSSQKGKSHGGSGGGGGGRKGR